MSQNALAYDGPYCSSDRREGEEIAFRYAPTTGSRAVLVPSKYQVRHGIYYTEIGYNF
jgi:hypothetical protein